MSSSFLMREVMSKPRKGFCSCSLVPGDTLLSFSSASRPSGGEAGDRGGDTESARLQLSSVTRGC